MIKKIQKTLKKFLADQEHVRAMSVAALLILITAIPLTVYLSQQRIQITQHASANGYISTDLYGCGEIVQDITPGATEGTMTFRSPISINNQWETHKVDGTILKQEDIRNLHRASPHYISIGSNPGTSLEHEVTRLIPNPDPTSADYHPETVTCRLWINSHNDCRMRFVDPAEPGKSNTNWLYVSNQSRDIQLHFEPNTGRGDGCDLEIHIHTPPPGGVPTITPTPAAGTPTVTPTGAVTPTGTTPTVAPTVTPVPTIAATPTIPKEPTQFSVSVLVPGVGQNGNTNPNRGMRDITFQLFDKNAKQIGSDVTGHLSFDGTVYKGTINFGTIMPTDLYVPWIVVGQMKIPVYASPTQLTAGITNVLPQVTLTTGDISADGKVDVLDYNMLLACFGAKQYTDSCSGKQADVDFNDDGIIDGIDYNIFLVGIKAATKK